MLHLKSSVAHCDLAKLSRSWVAFRGFWVGTGKGQGVWKSPQYRTEFGRREPLGGIGNSDQAQTVRTVWFIWFSIKLKILGLNKSVVWFT